MEKEIFPLYEQHEQGFDTQSRMHARMDIARAALFGEVMAKYYQDNKKGPIDLAYARRMIGWHDAGRKGNTKDVWEAESAQGFKDYLVKKRYTSRDSKIGD